MTAIQFAFLAGLSLVTVAIIAFGAVMIVGATRSGQGSYLSTALLQRMIQGSAERSEVDRWAFYLHRMSGFAIFAFLCLHVLDVSLYAASARLYSQVHDLYGNGVMRVFECGLLFGILFHTFNGLRVLILDVVRLKTPSSRAILTVCVLATLLLGVAGSVIILRPVFA